LGTRFSTLDFRQLDEKKPKGEKIAKYSLFCPSSIFALVSNYGQRWKRERLRSRDHQVKTLVLRFPGTWRLPFAIVYCFGGRPVTIQITRSVLFSLLLMFLVGCGGKTKFVSTWKNAEATPVTWENAKVAAFAMTFIKASRLGAEDALA
jgi:hypothetical protein